jgi:hypothetical protein
MMVRFLLNVVGMLFMLVFVYAFWQIFQPLPGTHRVGVWFWLLLMALGIVGFTCCKTLTRRMPK